MANERPVQPRRPDVPTPPRRPSSDDGTGPAGGEQSSQRMPPRRTWLSFLIILLINVAIVRFLFPSTSAPAKVPYTLFREQVAARNVQAIYSRGSSITGRFIKPITYPRDTTGGGRPAPVTDFATELPSFADPGLETVLINNGVEISAKPIQGGGGWLGLLSSFAPTLFIVALYVWIFRRASQSGGGLGGMLGGVGKSKARRYDQAAEDRVTFEDVAGIDEAENELVEIVDFLRDPKKYTRLGGTAPKGVLLVGAPGTGKTLLARAVAGEASVPFFSTSWIPSGELAARLLSAARASRS